jgi:hypothetical protein
MAAAGAADIGDRLKVFLPESIAAELVSKGSIQNTVYREKGAAPKLAPATPLAKEALAFWSGKDPSFFVETLWLYKKPDAKKSAAGADRGSISVLLRSVSHSRNKMRTLYETSYVVDSAATKKKIADPVSGSADGVSLVAIQKDLTFGEYLYSYRYRENADSVAFYSSNLQAMNYAVIRVLDPDKLRVSLVVQDLGDYFLVYNLTRADFFAIPGLDEKVNSSFTARADAIYGWFLKEYEKQ